jgi:hypothetical protein
LHPARAVLLAEVEAAGAAGDLFSLMKCWLTPVAAIRDEEGKHSFAGFMSQYMLRHQIQYTTAADFTRAQVDLMQHWIGLVAKGAPAMPTALLHYRLQITFLLFVNTIVRHDCDPRSCEGLDLELLTADAIRCGVAAMRAPLD